MGVLPALFPYVEQDSIYRQLLVDWNPTTSVDTPWWTNANNTTMAKSRLRVLMCPADDLYRGVTMGVIAARVFYDDGVWGAVHMSYSPTPIGNTLGLTNYLGVNGAVGPASRPERAMYEGLLYNCSQTSLGRVPDGTSNTLLFGEGIGGVTGGVREWGWSWMGCGDMYIAPGLQGPRNASAERLQQPAPSGGAVLLRRWLGALLTP